MAHNFKVGDKARIIRRESVFYGAEAVIVRVHVDREVDDAILGATHIVPLAYEVSVGGIRRHKCGRRIGYEPQDLAPILPPDEAADEFIARLNKLGSEPINDAPKVTVKVEAK